VVKRRSCLVALTIGVLPLALLGQGQAPAPAQPLSPDAEFTVAVSTTTIEGGPVYVADEGPRGREFRVINGGVRNVANGTAHAATNAETQMLIVSSTAPNVRMLFTVTEGLYRLVARKSAGINAVKDLRGKKIITPRNTSAHYHLFKWLVSGGLQESDVTIVPVDASQMAAAIARREADAISMWEPQSQDAADALGADATIFEDRARYRERFSLYSSTEVLNDPKRRRELVEFVRALLVAADRVRTRPKDVIPIIARVTKHSEMQIAGSWKHHAFPMALPADMLDVLVEEDRWVATTQQRPPRTREQLATFIDTSVLAEARKPAR
jgi:NitT/TauT family transport system substrate-binding protein